MLLNKSISVSLLGAYGTAEDFIKSMPTTEIDVALIDINLPGMDGIQCIYNMKPSHPQVQFLIFTVLEDDDKIFQALCAGASGYLLKSSTPEELEAAILEVQSGGSPMTSSIARKVVQSFNQKSNQQNQYSLTNREKELLNSLQKGFRYKEIADKMGISIDTVRSHTQNIYQKLQVQSRTDALNKYYKNT